MSVTLDPAVEKVLKKMRQSDANLARRLQALIDQASSDKLPQNAEPMTGEHMRRAFGGVTYKIRSGKFRVLFTPGKRIIAAGYRKDIYAILPGSHTN